HDSLPDRPGEGSRPGRLIIVRPAKSSWAGDAVDHDRPLSRRGRRDARALGAHLAARPPVPDRALVSDAVRCRQTWQLATEAGATAGEVMFSTTVYEASATDLLGQVCASPSSVSNLLLLGHNSSVVDLVRLLAAHTGQPDLWHRIDQKFPTSAVATLAVPAPWSAVAPGSAELLAYGVPRG
ncbi:MAG: histidine phosphatase family protein, partial [Propionibacteriales bacterium]|nr:histidine phosphatase family protein [Propionibacteriales bacterium]